LDDSATYWTLAQLIQALQPQDGPAEADATQDYRPAGNAPTAPVAALSTERSGQRGRAYYRRAAELIAQAAEALEHAHSLGIVHRDVKPANLLVGPGGKLWVSDFGLARLGADAGLTMSGDLLGTLRYMAPEQALARHGLVDHRADVYALGATLYELLTLRPAITGNDRQELLRQIAFEEPQPPRRWNRAIPAELETIVLKAMEKNLAERYATAKELADDLRCFREDRPIGARRPTVVHRLLKWSKRHQVALLTTCLLLMLAVIGLAIGSVLIWRQKTETGKALGRAEEQERLASANAARANAQRKRAELNLDWSLNTIRRVLVRLDGEEFFGLPAAPDVRRRLTAHGVRFLREHIDESSADPAVRQDTARIYGAIGMLHSGQGDHDAARAAFEKACAILEALKIDSPDNPTIWRQLGHNLFYLGEEFEIPPGPLGDAQPAEPQLAVERGPCQPKSAPSGLQIVNSSRGDDVRFVHAEKHPCLSELLRQVSDGSGRRRHSGRATHRWSSGCSARRGRVC
jgi:hypothetical protein